MSATLAFILANHAGLAITCSHCGNTKTQDVLAMALSYGENASLDRLEPKLAPCPKCGGKGRFEVWTTEYDREVAKREGR